MSLRSLSPVDQAHVRVLYGFAKDLYVAWMAMQAQPDWEALRARIVSFLSPPLSQSVKELGHHSLATCAPGDAMASLGKVLHDIRGGALMPLQLYAHMAQEEADPLQLRSAVFLARDQAKIMRNILPDLDPEVRRADESEKPHYIRGVADKWDGFRFDRPDQAPGHVSVHCSYDGLLASCCLEASAVDRIVYNYINNAIRFTAGPQIRLEILPVGEHVVRWMVANPITADQAAWLQDSTRGDLSSLFRGGITRGGHGLGLSNCADFVAAAFGLHDIDEALAGKYLGAVARDGWYLAWAHWPSLYTQ
ncbi:MAG: ATP-binding protein [Gammaproteobacteria bacterium]